MGAFLVNWAFWSIFIPKVKNHQLSRRMKRKERIFSNPEAKSVFQKGMKYLAISLPLLFASPILVTIGFKMLRRDQSYWLLILGCFLVVLTIVLVAQAFRLILKSLFAR